MAGRALGGSAMSLKGVEMDYVERGMGWMKVFI